MVGLATGNCTEDGLCLLYAWCPVQRSQNVTLSTALQNVQDFSIQVQTVAHWNHWHIQKYSRISRFLIVTDPMLQTQ